MDIKGTYQAIASRKLFRSDEVNDGETKAIRQKIDSIHRFPDLSQSKEQEAIHINEHIMTTSACEYVN